MPMTLTTKNDSAGWRVDARAGDRAVGCGGPGRGAVKKGQEVYAAQKCSDLPRHRRQGQQGESARRRRREAVGRRHQAVDHPPDRDGGEGEVDEEAADAGQVRQAAGGGPRRAGRLHAEPEVAGARDEPRGARRAIRSPMAGALFTTVSAVVFIALVIAVLSRDCSPTRTRAWSSSSRIPAVFVLGLLLIPVGMWLRAAQAAAPIQTAAASGRSSISAAPASRRTALLIIGAHRRQHRHRAARRLRRACTGWSRRASAARRATRRCTRSSPRGRTRRTRGVACVECHIGEGATGIRPRQALRRAAAGARRHQHVSAADSAGRRDAARRPGRDLRRLPPAGTRRSAIASASSASMPTTRRTRRRRPCCRCTSAARRRHRRVRFTGTPIPRVRVEYVATDAERQTIPYVQRDRRDGQVKEYVATGHEGRGDSRRRTAGRWTASTATTPSGIPSRRRRSRPSIGRSPPRW